MEFADRIEQAVQNANARVARRIEASEELRRQWEARRDQLRSVLHDAEHALHRQGFRAEHEDTGDSVSLWVERHGREHTLIFRPTDQAREGELLIRVEAGGHPGLEGVLVPDRAEVEARVIDFVESVANGGRDR